jgi:hypothetical protein
LSDVLDEHRSCFDPSTGLLVPLIHHTLPEEDTLQHRAQADPRQINIALITYPYASNLDEFDALIHELSVTVVPIREYTRLEAYHAILYRGVRTPERVSYISGKRVWLPKFNELRSGEFQFTGFVVDCNCLGEKFSILIILRVTIALGLDSSI